MSAQFQAEFLDGGGTLLHQDSTHFGAARERQFPYHVAFAKHFANFNGPVCIACQHVQHPGRKAGLACQFSQCQCAKRCLLRGLDDHRAPSRQCWRHFAGNHGNREVPGGNGCAHANALFQHQQFPAQLGRFQDAAFNALGLLGKPFHKAGPVNHFPFRFSQGLALFQGHQESQVVGIVNNQVKPLAQYLRTAFGRGVAPAGQGFFSTQNSVMGQGNRGVAHLRDGLASRGVVHLKIRFAGVKAAIHKWIGL